ncbi:MAG: butyrate kinase [Bacillota bacterium]
MDEVLLVVNPGSTSTKLALYKGDKPLSVDTLDHSGEEWATRLRTVAQLPYRVAIVKQYLERNGFGVGDLACIVARGGLLRPVRSGAYEAGGAMREDLMNEVGGKHASNLGGLIALEISQGRVPCYIVDPVSVDEYSEAARVSGIPGLPRKSLLHALNIRACAQRAAQELNTPLSRLYLVVAHLGSGFSTSPCYKGKLTDANNSNEEGPFTIERAGTLPALFLLDLAASQDPAALRSAIVSESGMYGYTGTKDARKVEEAKQKGGVAEEAWEAMAYQVGKEICAMAAAYPEKVDAVVLTGGLAKSEAFVGKIMEQTSFLGRHLVYPGEDEMRSLAEGALRVLRGHESARTYPDDKVAID